MTAIGFAILLAMVGTLIGALFTFVVGLAGAPGAMLTELVMRRAKTDKVPTWGLLLTLAGQLYIALAFVAFIVLTTNRHLSGQTGFGTWVAWTVAFFVSLVPAMAALKDSAEAEQRNVQHGATVFTAPLAAVGFFIFVFFPSTVYPLWSWVPTV